MTQYDPYTLSNERRGMSAGAKVAVGCGITSLLLIVLVCAGLIWAISYARRQAERFVQDFEGEGYTRVAAQTIAVTQPITTPTVFYGQSASIQADAQAPLAFAVQTAQISSRVAGDVDFIGQILEIKPGAVIEGDVNLKFAQVLTVEAGATILGDIRSELVQIITIEPGAIVEGQVAGNWQTINRPSAAPETPSSAPMQPQPDEPTSPTDPEDESQDRSEDDPRNDTDG